MPDGRTENGKPGTDGSNTTGGVDEKRIERLSRLSKQIRLIVAGAEARIRREVERVYRKREGGG